MNGIRLSDAIRLGSMLGPQAFHVFSDGHGGTCAMGAALLAVGVLDFLPRPPEAFPGVLNKAKGKWVSLYPQPGEVFSHCVWDEISYRNNELRMTREQIADWLVESGNDCSSVEIALAKDVAAKLISEHMVAK